MSIRRPPHQKWHRYLPVECTCDAAWYGRDLVDSACEHHHMIASVEDLVSAGWQICAPLGGNKLLKIDVGR